MIEKMAVQEMAVQEMVDLYSYVNLTSGMRGFLNKNIGTYILQFPGRRVVTNIKGTTRRAALLLAHTDLLSIGRADEVGVGSTLRGQNYCPDWGYEKAHFFDTQESTTRLICTSSDKLDTRCTIFEHPEYRMMAIATRDIHRVRKEMQLIRQRFHGLTVAIQLV